MSSLKALKRKNLQKQKNNKENNILSKSWPNLSDNKENTLKRSKSESDIHKIDPPKNKKDLKLHAKSELFLQSVFKSKFTTSTPDNTMSMSPVSSTNNNIMQSSAFSVITDSEQIKIPIIGYEVMEERSRFTVSSKTS
jgi:hypothetical protein